ncbi:MAG: hypothetical protein B6229_00295 [Spirochaetaceae bacterium 4572_7]|nr:MAG: hypothetical protein B6229_00295 [Spirochaetaceae bacterium 4572_7]
MENNKKNKRYKPLWATFLMLTILLVGSVSAMDWDNIKEYIEEEDRIDVYNSWILPGIIKGQKLVEVSLIENTEYCIENCYAILEFNLLTDYDNVMPSFEAYDIPTQSQKIDLKEYKISIREEGKTIIVPDYGEVCTPVDKVNGTEGLSCVWEQTGTHEETEYIYTEYDGELLEAGTYYFKIQGKKTRKQSVDWVASIMGVETEEWAVWTAGFNVGLEAYYNFSSLQNAVGVIANDIAGQAGTPELVTNTSCMSLGGSQACAYFAEGEWFIANDTATDVFNATVGREYTYSGWYRKIATANKLWMGKGTSANGWNFAFINGDNNVQMKDGSYNSANPEQEDNTWVMWTATINATDLCLYLNGTLDGCLGGATWGDHTTTKFTMGGLPDQGGNELIGYLDEWGFWNRTLSATEITDLWNEGNGLTYTGEFLYSPIVNLIDPLNDTNFSVEVDDFNFNISYNGASDWINYTFQVYNSTSDIVRDRFVENGTVDDDCFIGDGEGDPTYIDIECNGQDIEDDGTYEWNVWGCNSDNLCDWDTNLTFTLDKTDPEVTIIYPTGDLVVDSVPYNVSFNVSVTDNLNLENCIYYNGTANTTITCGENATIQLEGGEHTLIYYANDTAGNFNYSAVTFYLNYVFENASYTDPGVVGESYDFSLNLTASVLDSYNGTFFYNGTEQTTSESNLSNVITLTSSTTLTGMGNVSFYYQYGLNGVLYNSSTYYHIVNEIQNLSIVEGQTCPAGLSPALRYDFKNEQNDSTLNATIDYIFRYGITNNTLKSTYGNLIHTDLTICINSTVYNNYSIGYGEIQYNVDGYSDRRYYAFDGDRLSNVTINNTLYSLLSGDSTSFLFTIQQADLSVYDDVYLTLNRWYPDEDQYKVAEMSATDEEGQTVMKVEIEDVDYRVGVYNKDGTLIHLAEAIRLVCIATPCTYSLTVPEDAGTSFENWKDLQVSLLFNESTGVFTFTYNDPSQDTSRVNLSVFKDTGQSSLTICTDTNEGYTGVLVCNVSSWSGTLRAVGYRTASPETSIISKMVEVGRDKLGQTSALFITLIVMIFLVSVGVVSPVLTVILSVLAFIPAMALGIMPLPILLIMAAMGFIVIHFMKRGTS